MTKRELLVERAYRGQPDKAPVRVDQRAPAAKTGEEHKTAPIDDYPYGTCCQGHIADDFESD